MSHKATAWAMQQKPAQASEKWVLVILADFHNSKTGLCYPSATTISELSLLNERTVRRITQSLEDQGYIKITKRTGKSPHYDFHWRRTPDTVSGVKKHTVQGSQNTGGTERPKLTPDTVSGVDPGHGVTPDIDDTNPGHGVRTPRTSTTLTPGMVSDEPGINQEITSNEPEVPDLPLQNWSDDQLAGWVPTSAFKTLYRHIQIDDDMLAMFRLQLIDWKRKGYLASVNVEKKFAEHCNKTRLEREQSAADHGQPEPRKPNAAVKSDEEFAAEVAAWKAEQEKLKQASGPQSQSNPDVFGQVSNLTTGMRIN